MGGHALKKVETQRLNKDDYEKIKKEIYHRLSSHIPIYFISEITGKKDFGDLDILYQNPTNKNIYSLLQQLFQPKEIVKNGYVISFSYLISESQNVYFQIDLIYVNYVDMALFYYNYGDYGQLLGRIVKHYGLTFGSDGLWFVPSESTCKSYIMKNIDEFKSRYGEKIINQYTGDLHNSIILTRDPKEICDLLELNYETWKKGFKDTYKIFDFIKSTPYFKPSIFQHSNHPQRHRLKTRKMYEEFVGSIFGKEECERLKEEKESISERKYENKQIYAIQYFDKEDELKKEIHSYFLHAERKMKFNGNILQSQFNIQPKDLGTIIPNFKKFISESESLNFEEWLDLHNGDTIITIFTIWLDTYGKDIRPPRA